MSENKPLLVGIIIDVSNSMQRSWKHHSSEKLPRFDVIRDVLNEQIWKVSSLSGKRPIEIFCLGMGFKKEVTFIKENLEKKKETKIAEERESIIQTNLVCDLLALGELIPTSSELDSLEKALNEKWNDYAHKILWRVQEAIEDDIYNQLKDFIAKGLYQSAYDRLHKSLQYRLYIWMQNTPIRRKVALVNKVFQGVSKYVSGWEKKIDDSCYKESEKFFDRIQNQSKRLFKENQSDYVQRINGMLEDFAIKQIQIILELLSVGHTTSNVLEHFDEETAFEIATQIYDHLNDEVEKKIRIPLIANLGVFLKDMRFELNASLDHQKLRLLTEKCIQKYAWGILEPFVQQTVFNLINGCFRQQVEKMFLYWVSIASCREVIQPIHMVKSILPSITYEKTLRDKYMFGTTPIKEAFNLASIRLLNKKYEGFQKILVVVSDGEFEIDQIEQSLRTPIHLQANLLKQAGITIVSLYVVNRNILTMLVSKVSSRWPRGAKIMFEIASRVAENSVLEGWLYRHNYECSTDSKLFIQINESELLKEVFDGLLLASEGNEGEIPE